MNEKKKATKNPLLESLKNLQLRPDDKFIVSILGVPVGIFKNKQDIEAVINYLNTTEMAIFHCREWDSGEVFNAYIEAKTSTTTLH